MINHKWVKWWTVRHRVIWSRYELHWRCSTNFRISVSNSTVVCDQSFHLQICMYRMTKSAPETISSCPCVEMTVGGSISQHAQRQHRHLKTEHFVGPAFSTAVSTVHNSTKPRCCLSIPNIWCNHYGTSSPPPPPRYLMIGVASAESRDTNAGNAYLSTSPRLPSFKTQTRALPTYLLETPSALPALPLRGNIPWN